MKRFEAKVTREADSHEETTCVHVQFEEGRVSGALNFMVMARPENIRYQGTVTINGIEYRASMSLECGKIEVQDYALDRVGSYSVHPSPSALKAFHAVLTVLVERVRLIPAFQAQQKATAIKYLGYDIERAISEIREYEAKIEALRSSIDTMQDQIIDYKQELIYVYKASGLAVYSL